MQLRCYLRPERFLRAPLSVEVINIRLAGSVDSYEIDVSVKE